MLAGSYIEAVQIHWCWRKGGVVARKHSRADGAGWPNVELMVLADIGVGLLPLTGKPVALTKLPREEMELLLTTPGGTAFALSFLGSPLALEGSKIQL